MFIKDIGLYLSFLVISLSGEGSSKTLSRTKKGVSEYLGEGLSASWGQHGLGNHASVAWNLCADRTVGEDAHCCVLNT